MKSEDTVEDPLMSVQLYIKSKGFFSFRVTVHLLFSILLQRTLKSVFLKLYQSLKPNHDTNYLMTSEDTFEDPLMSVQFFVKSKSFFHFVLQSILCFHFYCKTRLNLYFYHAMDLQKLNHDTDHLMTSEDTVEDPLISVQFYIKRKTFFILSYSPSTVIVFNGKDA